MAEKIIYTKQSIFHLTHLGRVTHICVGKLSILGSANGLAPGRRQAIIWTNDGILLIGLLRTNFSEFSIKIQTFSFKKMHLNRSSVKWRPFFLFFKYKQLCNSHNKACHFLMLTVSCRPLLTSDRNWYPSCTHPCSGIFHIIFNIKVPRVLLCELKWSGGWSTGTVDWLSASERVNTWMGVPRWIPSAWFHFHSCQTWYSGLLRTVLMAHQCWYHPKHSNQARME